MSYEGRPENLDFSLEEASLKLRSEIREKIELATHIAVDGIINALKTKYPIYKDDYRILAEIFKKWHLPSTSFNPVSQLYLLNGDFLRLCRADAFETVNGIFRAKDFIFYAAGIREISDIVLQKLDVGQSEKLQQALSALEAWRDSHGDPFAFRPDGKHRFKHWVGYIACSQKAYEEIEPHLGLLYLTRGLTSEKPPAKKEKGHGLATKNKD
jgi:hypothetical protein